MRVQLANIAKSHGAQVVLDDVTLTVGPRSRIGLVGPNGVGKSTLLADPRRARGAGPRDRGAFTRDAHGRVPRAGAPRRAGESVLRALAQRTGVLAAERELEDSAAALARGERADERYSRALDALRRAGRRRLRATGAGRLRRPRARRRPRSRPGRTLGRRVRARRACGDPPLALRRPPPRRADERSRLRRARAAGVVPRHVPRRARRRLARPRAARPHRRSDRGDRAAIASAPEWAGGWSEYAAARDAGAGRARRRVRAGPDSP